MLSVPRRPLAALAAVAILAGVGAMGAAAQGDQRCFPQTNLCISGPIRQYWERNGGLPVFGYPITPLQNERVEGWTGPVQWFERDRLEDHGADGLGVLAGRLGVERLAKIGRPWQQRAAPRQAPGCAAFAETGYAMCGGFRSYWEANGGLERFGYPITDERDEVIEGRSYRVQYFERRRMEYHPEVAPGAVLLGLLGRDVHDPVRPPPPVGNPTPSADQLGVGGVVGSFDNGGIVCNDGDLLIDALSGPPELPGIVRAPCVIDLRIQGVGLGQRIAALVRAPDGTAYAEAELVADEIGALWRLPFLLGVPQGSYSVEITPEGGAPLDAVIDVTGPDGARALVLPTAADLRDTLTVYISGLPPGGRHELYLYRRSADGTTADFVRRLGVAGTSDRGEGELSFQMQPGDPAAGYQAGYYIPAGITIGNAACTDDPRNPGGSFCFETFVYNP